MEDLGISGVNYSTVWNRKQPNIQYSPSPSFVDVQSLSHVQLFITQWTAARQASLFFTISRSLLRLMSFELVIPTISFPVVTFSSRLQSFPASGSFPVSQLFVSGGQSTGASALASLLLKNIQGWFPLEVTGLISLLSKGLLRIFSGTTFRKHQFFGAHPKSSSKLTQLVTLASLGIPHLELYDPNPLENSLDFFVFALTYLEHSFTTYCYTSPTMLHTQTWLNYNTQLDHQLDIFYVTRLPSLPIRLCHSINWPHNVQFSVSTSICLFIFVCVCVCGHT